MKTAKLLLLMSATMFLFCSCITGMIYDASIKHVENKILRRCPEVKSVESLADNGLLYGLILDLRIIFKDGRKLLIQRVENNLGGDDLRIKRIGNMGYSIIEWERNGKIDTSMAYTAILSKITGIKLGSVIDIIDNYDVLFEYTAQLPDSNDYPFEFPFDLRKFFDPEWNLDIFEDENARYIIFKYIDTTAWWEEEIPVWH
jgi:hypothetical protein